jgi:hypothetical protein
MTHSIGPLTPLRPISEVIRHREGASKSAWKRNTPFIHQKSIAGDDGGIGIPFHDIRLVLQPILMPEVIVVSQDNTRGTGLLRGSNPLVEILGNACEWI